MTNNDHYVKLENMMHSALVMQLTGGKVNITKGEAQITLPVSKGFVHSTGAMHGALWDHITDETQCFWPNLGAGPLKGPVKTEEKAVVFLPVV